MKIWHEHSADHSAKLKIIGKFKTVDDAKLAMTRMDDIMKLMQQELEYIEGAFFPKEVHKYMIENNFCLSKSAIESAEYYHDIEQSGTTIEVNTDELEIQLFIETFINCCGKIEIFSKHNY